jgi:hypothetical protein
VREFQTASDGDGERLPAGEGGGDGEAEKLREGGGASAGQMEMKCAGKFEMERRESRAPLV